LLEMGNASHYCEGHIIGLREDKGNLHFTLLGPLFPDRRYPRGAG
jgi:hypothetical protein